MANDLDGLPAGALVLTGSLRRRAQVLARRPDVEVRSIRGNVDTRLARWRSEGAAAVVLARAGLARLGIVDVPAHPLDPTVMIPAPGQGTLALEVKAGSPAEEACARLDHAPSRRAALAERRVVAAFGGDCTLPLAAWAREDEETGDGGLRLTALLATPDGRRAARAEAAGATPEAAADACIAALRRAGADEVLAALRAGVEGADPDRSDRG